MYANRCQIVIGAKSLEYTREPVASNATEYIPYKFITNITPIYEVKPGGVEAQYWNYRFNSMTVLVFTIKHGKIGRRFQIELQEVTNQPTWSGGTLADIQQAIDDINGGIPVPAGFLEQENGFDLLQENGSKILI